MRIRHIVAASILLLIQSGHSMELKVGVSIDDAVKAMQAEKHEGAPVTDHFKMHHL
jgi:hypothetical protein